MKMKSSVHTIMLLLFSLGAVAQMDQYDYYRELAGVKDQWHQLELPTELFNKVKPDFSDIRIYGISTEGDTTEAPYFLSIEREKVLYSEIPFKVINESYDGSGFYFTFEVPVTESVNELKLKFRDQNFDWRVQLEGSQDQLQWFTITENYRILSIQNELTNYKFTTLKFPTSNYRYFRIKVNAKSKPELKSPTLISNQTSEVDLLKYKIKNFKSQSEKSSLQTIININLLEAVPIHQLSLQLNSNFDYYRPISISYLRDSTKTEKGYIYNYSTLTSGVLSSLEPAEFQFTSTTIGKLKIVIDNQDNEPLNVVSASVKGYKHKLVARFTKPATYFLTYGNTSAYEPRYDINRFTENIPDSLATLSLQDEQIISRKEAVSSTPLFENKNWLWAVMGVVILLLGWFSLKMIKNKEG